MSTGEIPLLDFHPRIDSLRDEVLAGLRATPRRLPSKLFYDARGSALFDRICELPEYYLTRTETAILQAHAADMAACIGPNVTVVEFGSGSSTKTRLLLEALASPVRYVPIDISREHLVAAAQRIDNDFPGLEVRPVCADYTDDYDLPERHADSTKNLVFFPGSTLGNFSRDEALRFLRHVARVVGSRGELLIGIDLVKDPATLIAAYDDAQGVTAEFNLNLLYRIARELETDLEPARFVHVPVWNAGEQRMESYLESTADHDVRLEGGIVHFSAGERIHTEYSHKYTVAGFAELAAAAGFHVLAVWTDPQQRFSVQLLEVDGDGAAG